MFWSPRNYKNKQKNMDNIELTFKDNETTAGKLLKAARVLISIYGYDATTTRMIANLAKVNLSAINFHFGNKENLVREAMIKAGEKMSGYYCTMTNEIRDFLKEEPDNKEKAWEYIERLVTDRIQRTFNHERSWVDIGLISHENDLPETSRGILAEHMINDNEQVLAELILAVSDKKDVFQAALISRMINASIISYIEKPLLNQYMEKALEIDFHDMKKIEAYMLDYFMKSIKAAVAGE